MKQQYKEMNLRPATLRFIGTINEIIGEYQRQGYVLTVRQLYYQLVARDIIPNTLREYKRVASIINDGKLDGRIDWDALEDRTRSFIRRQRWQNGPHILRACVQSYHQDLWKGQDFRVFVIIEKEALVGVLESVCHAYDVPLLAARGYPSGSVLREFVQTDILPTMAEGQRPIVLHLGDHDPSGIDMTRDLEERLSLFANGYVGVHRLALNMDQIEERQPPENPAKVTDSRFEGYAREFGESSWELDALEPTYLNELVEAEIKERIDDDQWALTEDEISGVQDRLQDLADKWE